MKNIITIILIISLGLSHSYAITAKKPTVMVVPEESFCINQGYYTTDARGNKIPDYKKALQNENILDVINTFENLMDGYGFPLTNLQQSLNAIQEDKSLSLILTSKDDADIIEDDLDKLSRTANADIIVKIAPVVTPFGPQKQMKLRVTSIDCASKKTIKSFGPIERTSAGSTSAIFKAAVSDNIESFVNGLATYFTNLQTKGREGSIIIKVSESCPLNLESEVSYKGEKGELGDLIDLWISENAVNGSYTGGKTSRNNMVFEQVRIPLTSKVAFGKEKALNMEDFVKTGLTKLLANYGISVATHSVGIGKAYIVLGGL